MHRYISPEFTARMWAVRAAVMAEWGWTDASHNQLARRRHLRCPDCGAPMLPDDLAFAAMCGRHAGPVAEAVPGPGYARAELVKSGIERYE